LTDRFNMIIDYIKSRFWNRGNCFTTTSYTRGRWNNAK